MATHLKDRMRPHIVKLLQKTHLNRIAHRFYYNHLHGFQTANRAVLDAQRRCFEHVVQSGVAENGDYFEFGIFKGYAFWHAQQIANEHRLSGMRFFGFDSFAGLPEITGIDRSDNDVFYQGQYQCAKEDVEKNLSAKGVDWQRTFLVPGYFDRSLVPETRSQYGMGKIALALIDCDLYASTRDVLNFIGAMLLDQTLLMFDDWNCYDRDDNRGQRKAFREFLDTHPDVNAQPFLAYGAYGQVFVLSKGMMSE